MTTAAQLSGGRDYSLAEHWALSVVLTASESMIRSVTFDKSGGKQISLSLTRRGTENNERISEMASLEWGILILIN